MVRGIDTFKELFKGFEDNYVIIGGTACEIHEELYAQVPRAFVMLSCRICLMPISSSQQVLAM